MDSKIANIDYSILIFILYSFDKFKLTCIKHKESEKKKKLKIGTMHCMTMKTILPITMTTAVLAQQQKMNATANGEEHINIVNVT